VSGADFFLHLFSTPELRHGETGKVLLPAGKPLAVLAYLLLEGRSISRDELADLLWPDADRGHGKASVRQALWILRKALGQEAFLSEDPVELASGKVDSDLAYFRAALEAGELKEALGLWTVGLLDGLEFPGAREWLHWVDELRTREEEAFGAALAAAAAQAGASGDTREARGWLEAALEVRPYDPSLHRALIETLLHVHALSAAQEALRVARSALEDPESHPFLEELGSRLSSLRMNAGAEAGPRSLRTEFVGRTVEFSAMASQWRQAKQGRSRLALVVGAPGIGKTRLAEELAALVASEEGTRVALKAMEVERTLQWGMVTELVRSLHGLSGAAGISNRSASVLTRLVPSLPGPGSDMGTTGFRGLQAAAVTDALLDLVKAVAEETPLFIVLDDLQWVDRESRAALSHLARNLNQDPLLLVITCRTGERDPEVQKALESLRRIDGAEAFELSPLQNTEVSELLALLLEDVEPAEMDSLGTRIHGITQGNPLFIVEMLKLFHDQGLLRSVDGGKWRLDGALMRGKLPVPGTVESAIRRRLDDLGEQARLLAAYLAQQARPTPQEELRRQTGLDPFQVSEGLQELFDRDLVRRNAQERLRFVHDAVEEVARKHLQVPEVGGGAGHRSWWRRRPVLGASILGAVAVATLLIVGIWAGLGPLAWLRGDGGGLIQQDYPFGEGQIFALTDSGALWVRPPSSNAGEWVASPAEAIPTKAFPRLFGPYRVAGDSLLWFVNYTDDPGKPPYAGIPLPDGTVRPIWKVPGDVGFQDLSPDGRFALLMQQNLESEGYRQDLLVLDRASGQARVIYRGPEILAGTDWAPDGLKIAVAAQGVADTIHILDSQGGSIAAFGFPDRTWVLNPSWCSDSDRILFRAHVNGKAALGLLQVSTGAVEFFHGVSARNAPLCLGDGGKAVVVGPSGDDLHLLLMDLETAETRVLPTPTGSVLAGRMIWVPDSVPVVFRSLSILPARPEVRWGRRTTLAASAEFSDGTVRPAQVAWEALDPNRASVDSSGTVSGNQAGSAPIVAHYAPGVADTVSISILGWERPDVVLHSDFHGEDLIGWEQFSDPPARLVDVGGARVLSLEGDGRFRDVVISDSTFSLDQGLRLEVEFQLQLTQKDHQRIDICLQPGQYADLTGTVYSPGTNTFRAFCVRFPAGVLVKYDPMEAAALYDRLAFLEYFRLPPGTDPSQWTQFAMDVQPDGQVAVFVNQILIESLRPRLVIEPGDRWRIQLAGASENTHLYVRNVTVFSGQEEG